MAMFKEIPVSEFEGYRRLAVSDTDETWFWSMANELKLKPITTEEYKALASGEWSGIVSLLGYCTMFYEIHDGMVMLYIPPSVNSAKEMKSKSGTTYGASKASFDLIRRSHSLRLSDTFSDPDVRIPGFVVANPAGGFCILPSDKVNEREPWSTIIRKPTTDRRTQPEFEVTGKISWEEVYYKTDFVDRMLITLNDRELIQKTLGRKHGAEAVRALTGEFADQIDEDHNEGWYMQFQADGEGLIDYQIFPRFINNEDGSYRHFKGEYSVRLEKKIVDKSGELFIEWSSDQLGIQQRTSKLSDIRISTMSYGTDYNRGCFINADKLVMDFVIQKEIPEILAARAANPNAGKESKGPSVSFLLKEDDDIPDEVLALF